jgi:hypothetical protein
VYGRSGERADLRGACPEVGGAGTRERQAALRDGVAAFRGSDTVRDRVVGVLRTPSAPRAENGGEDGGPRGRFLHTLDGAHVIDGASSRS